MGNITRLKLQKRIKTAYLGQTRVPKGLPSSSRIMMD
jgi:hypothetical protein